MCTTSLQCALTMGDYLWWNAVYPSFLKLCCYVMDGGGREAGEEQKTEGITRQRVRADWMLEPSHPFLEGKKSFFATMSLLQDFFAVYIISASTGICLF